MLHNVEKVAWEKLTPAGSSRAEGSIVLVGEASEVGWPPGKWPSYVTVENDELFQGSRLFGPREAIEAGPALTGALRLLSGQARSEFVGYRYPQVDESLAPLCEINILND